jgi:hypothetical protein
MELFGKRGWFKIPGRVFTALEFGWKNLGIINSRKGLAMPGTG